MFQLIVLNVIHQKCQNSCVGALVTYSLVRDMDNSPGLHGGNGRAGRSRTSHSVNDCGVMELLPGSSGSTPGWEGQLGFSRAGDVPKHLNLAFTLPAAIPQMSLRMVWQGSTAVQCRRGQSKGSCCSAPQPAPSPGVCAGKGETSTLLCT